MKVIKKETKFTDREIDALVAEKIFNWRWFECVQTACLVHPMLARDWDQQGEWMYKPLPGGPGKLFRDDIDGIRFYDSSKGGHTHPHIEEFSTKIECAWMVINKMSEYKSSVSWLPESKEWFVTFNRSNKESIRTALSDTAPRAICIAALRCQGIELE